MAGLTRAGARPLLGVDNESSRYDRLRSGWRCDANGAGEQVLDCVESHRDFQVGASCGRNSGRCAGCRVGVWGDGGRREGSTAWGVTSRESVIFLDCPCILC
jgi:hypothetical protein